MAFLAALVPAVGSLFSGGLSTALTVGSTALGAVSAIGGAKAQADAARYNAEVQRQQAGIEQNNAAAKATEQSVRTRQKMAAVRATTIQNGMELSGSPLDILDTVNKQGTLEYLTALYDGDLRARGLQTSAKLNDATAERAGTAGWLNAGSTLLTGFSKLYG